MATNSILRDVTIRDRKTGRAFVHALENASGKASQPTTITRVYTDVKGEDIKEMFGEKAPDDRV